MKYVIQSDIIKMKIVAVLKNSSGFTLLATSNDT